MNIKPDTPSALEFLRRWCPSGPWVLTAIAVEGKEISTRTFKREEDCRAWITKYNGCRNLYFHVNPVTRELNRKAGREDIAELAWLHVDVDPRAGEDLKEEQKRALRILRDPPAGVPKPTAIIYSGGGYQAFWKLKEPIPINGELGLAEDAKRYNLQLEMLFGADHCHNIDRIMRLPGTINIPDAKKQKKGRTPQLSFVVEWVDENVYPISDFTPAQIVQAGSDSFVGPRISVPGNIKRLSDIQEIDEHAKQGPVPDWCKVLIVQGNDPNEPTKYESRSEALFAACCEMVRRGVDDEIIYTVITDPDFGISSSVLDKKSSAERYALRQIERAKEDAIHPMLRTLNERYAVIGSMGGKCRVIEDVHDHVMGRGRITRQSFQDFMNRYMNKKIEVGSDKTGMPIHKPMGKWWLEHEMRRQYETIVFSPSKEVPNAYNLWRGFSCEAKPGDCSLFLAHVKDNICGGVEEYYNYILGWMAHTVQFPDRPGESAIVLRGRQGTGKSFFAKTFGGLFGRHFMQVADPKHLVGSFNSHLRDCIVLFGDEAFYAGDKKHESVLKMLITEEVITIEAKGIDAEASRNFLHVILASNSNWVVPADSDERRFFVLDVQDGQMQSSVYFSAIKEQLDNGGQEALLHFLLTFDLTDFNVRKIPRTKALMEQKLLSMDAEKEWWFHKLEDGRILSDHVRWEREVDKNVLLNDYLTYAQRIGIMRRANATALGRFLKRVSPVGYPRSRQKTITVYVEDDQGMPRPVNRRPYVWQFPTLELCRKHWDDNFGGPHAWPEEESDIPELPKGDPF